MSLALFLFAIMPGIFPAAGIGSLGFSCPLTLFATRDSSGIFSVTGFSSGSCSSSFIVGRIIEPETTFGIPRSFGSPSGASSSFFLVTWVRVKMRGDFSRAGITSLPLTRSPKKYRFIRSRSGILFAVSFSCGICASPRTRSLSPDPETTFGICPTSDIPSGWSILAVSSIIDLGITRGTSPSVGIISSPFIWSPKKYRFIRSRRGTFSGSSAGKGVFGLKSDPRSIP